MKLFLVYLQNNKVGFVDIIIEELLVITTLSWILQIFILQFFSTLGNNSHLFHWVMAVTMQNEGEEKRTRSVRFKVNGKVEATNTRISKVGYLFFL